MKNMEITRQRRARLGSKMPAGSIAILPASKDCIRNADTHYRFRQNSNFAYLTDCEESDGILVVFAGSPERSILFHLPKDPALEQWTGRRLGSDGVKLMLGISEAYPLSEWPQFLAQHATGFERIYIDMGQHAALEADIIRAIAGQKSKVRRGVGATSMLCDIEPIISEMRLFKDDFERAQMQKAADISVQAHREAMQAAPKLQYEYELEAILMHRFLREGCRAPAYDPIVASGENACILHYTANNAPLANDALILIDAGAEYANYASDITRTFPKSGQFSDAQRAVYEVVLRAQQAGIALIAPGTPWNAIQEVMVRILCEGMVELGILKGDVQNLIASEAYKPYYMHNSGHWLGLDVHDAGHYKKQGEFRTLLPGMVLTVEPGLYLSAMIPGLAKDFHGIGVRIEDDILVTESGHVNLTRALPTNVKDIEDLMRG